MRRTSPGNRLARHWALALALAFAGSPGFAAVSWVAADEVSRELAAPAADAQIAALIEQLGAEDFGARERAQHELSQLGLAAFDALHLAQNHHDPEIALRARYLVRSMSVRWFAESDSPRVINILKGYGDLSEPDRKSRIDRLAALEDGAGLIPLARLSRFEAHDPTAKSAALKVLEAPLPPTLDKAELIKAIHEIVGNSKRPAAQWLKLYARTLEGAADVLDEWETAAQAEHEVLARNPERTSKIIVRDLDRFQVELLDKAGKHDEAIEVVRRTFNLLDEGAPEQIAEIVDWLLKREAYSVAVELMTKREATVKGNPLLLYRLAETQQRMGQADEAEKTAAEALGLRPEALEEHLLTGYMLQDERGLMAWAEREYAQVLKSAAQGSVADFRGRFYLSELLHDQAKELAAAETLKPVCDLMEKDPAARDVCEQARRLPDSVISRMHYFFACHFHEAKDAVKEREHLEKAIGANDEDADVLIAMYRLPEADEAWTQNVKQRITQAAARCLEEIQAAEMHVARAENEGEKAAAEYDLSVFCNEYAWLVGNTFGDYQEAIRQSRRSLELRPNYYGYLDTLGRCYFTSGDLVSALKYQRQAVREYPHSGQIRRQLEFFEREAKAKGVVVPKESEALADAPQPKAPQP